MTTRRILIVIVGILFSFHCPVADCQSWFAWHRRRRRRVGLRPDGVKPMTGMKFKSNSKVFSERGSHRIGMVYRKALYHANKPAKPG